MSIGKGFSLSSMYSQRPKRVLRREGGREGERKAASREGRRG
jgi:hypothetical protein